MSERLLEAALYVPYALSVVLTAPFAARAHALPDLIEEVRR